MKILITGATGFVGQALLRRLKTEDVSVTCLVRKSSAWRKVKEEYPEAHFIFCDLADIDSVTNLNVEADSIIHCAVVHDSCNPENVYHTNMAAVQGLLALAEKSAIDSFLLMGSIEATHQTADPYARSKREAEDLLRKSGIKYAILRSTLIYGEIDHLRPLSRFLIKIKNSRFIPVIGNGKNIMQPVYVGDVANCIWLILQKGMKRHEYDIGGRSVLPCNELLNILSCFLSKKTFNVHIPLFLLMPALAVFELLRPNSKINRNKVRMFFRDQACDIGPLIDGLGYTPVDLRTGLALWKKQFDATPSTSRLDIF